MAPSDSPPIETPGTALARWRGSGPARAVASRIEANEDAFVTQLEHTVLADVPAFTDSANPSVRPLLRAQLAALAREFVRLARGGDVTTPAFVVDYATAAAEQYFPLEPILHAYRACARALLPVMIGNDDASIEPAHAIDAAAVVLEFIDRLSTTAAEHHVDRSRLLADVASDQRGELLAILLGGHDESDRGVSRLLRDAGYLDRRLAFCVVLAQSIDPAEMSNPARARRLADFADRALAGIPGRRLVDIHRNKVAMVVSHVRRLSGWSTPDDGLAARVADELAKVGPAARIGVSDDALATALIPNAYRQASAAFEVSSVGRRVVRFSNIPLRLLMRHFAGEPFRRVLPAWASAYVDADDRMKGALTRTLAAYAEASMNVLAAARALGLHPNTLYARFERITAVTGRDPRRFHALSELLIVCETRDASP